MITRLTLSNFKSVGKQVYDFTQFDLLVGRNNSGKSTVLQALAIWQFCVDAFHQSKRSGSMGIQVVLPNFTALPVPEFNLLWKDRNIRHSLNKKPEYILIGIHVEWQRATGETGTFGVDLRYHSPQTIYAIPDGGWAKFRDCEKQGDLPVIAYVPPFSGLEPAEKGNLGAADISRQVGKGQPGSVLRNLLLRVCPSPVRGQDGRIPKGYKPPADWQELADIIKRWFSVKIQEPKYDSIKDVYIKVDYQQNSKDYDIIAGGSGFHQTLTLMAFLYGYQPTTILLDEPDAHLHVNLQREILDYFKRKSVERKTQFLIATHAEEFIRGVDANQIVSLWNQRPTRIQSTPEILRAMAEVKNEEITRVLASPYMLYVEGESDERILRNWVGQCGAQEALDQVCFKVMGGGGKENMKKRADEHFAAIKHIVPQISRLMLFDYDSVDEAFHPKHDNPAVFEWKRKNIENYLLVPKAWKRAALEQCETDEDDLFAKPIIQAIDDFFAGQNLTLPPKQKWRDVAADIFSVVDGKRILFEKDDALFQRLKKIESRATLNRERVALSMASEEIHEDVHRFFEKLNRMVGGGKA